MQKHVEKCAFFCLVYRYVQLMSTSGRSVSVQVAAAALLHSETCIKCFLSVFVLSLSFSLSLSLSLSLSRPYACVQKVNFHTCAVFFFLSFLMLC